MPKKALLHGGLALALLGIFLYFLASAPTGPAWSAVEIPLAPPETAESVVRGKDLFARHCALCHGPTGKGDGPVAATYKVRPRDLTSGVYKFKSTPSGSLPSDADLFRTVTAGLANTAMRHFSELPAEERWALVHFLKSLAVVDDGEGNPFNRFQDRPAAIEIDLTPTHPWSHEASARGRAVYFRAKCDTCHGAEGRGDGPLEADLKDDWGRHAEPPDLTRGPDRFKTGYLPADIFRTISVGIPGTPMPSAETFPASDRWDLAYYVWGLFSKTPPPPSERSPR